MAVKAGSIRFNTDTSQLELYDGNQWTGILATSPEHQTGGTRGVFGGGSGDNKLQYINIASTGNAVDFGTDLTQTKYLSSASSSRTRGCFNGGYTNTGGSAYTNHIEYITISSTGGGTTFGDLTQLAAYSGSCSSSTRGIRAGGTAPANPSTDTIDYYLFAQTGNAIDFGNLTTGTGWNSDGTVNSPTRGMWIAGGPGSSNVIDYITMATTGNAADFGDASLARSDACGVCNAVRGAWGGGYASPADRNIIDYITIASLGNALDFGDMTIASRRYAACSSPTRGVWGGGHTPSATDVIDYITITSEGNAVDFGNLTSANYEAAGLSNGHGGL